MRWLGNYFLEWLRGPWPEIYFIRHGHGFHQLGWELFEKQGVGRSPRHALGVDIPNHLVPLSPLGRWQGDQTRQHLLIQPDCIYVSQMARAIETADRIFPGRSFRVDARLNEKDFGPAHMLGPKDLKQRFPYHFQHYQADGKYFSSKAPGGENYPDLLLKTHSFLDTLRRDWANKTVAAICHSAIMSAIRQLFEHYLPEELLVLEKNQWIHNCGILHYTHSPHFWGWRRGKFRLQLAQPPYKLWNLTNTQRIKLQRQALQELKTLRQQFKKIK